MAIAESEFYKTLESLEGVEAPTGFDGVYPTEEELKKSLKGKEPSEFLPVLAYFACNPVKDEDAIPGYRQMKDFCSRMIAKIETVEG